MKGLKKNIIFGIIFLVILIICVVLMSGSKGNVANIYMDGNLVKSIDLKKVNESFKIDIGEHNTVLVEHGKISMYEADCPDQLCVKQGEISDSAYPIVCLPNKVIIRISD